MRPYFELEDEMPVAPPPWTPRACKTGRHAPPRPRVEYKDVSDRRVRCAGRAGAADVIRGVVKRAVEMMDNTIAELTKAREAACRGEPLGWPSLGDVTACWLKYKLLVCIDQPAVWTGGTWDLGTVAEVIRRLVVPRDLLAGDQLTYSCVTNCEALVNARTWAALAGPGGQPVCNPGTPPLLIELCPHFWNAATAPYRTQTIIHEASHLTHCGLEESGTRVSIGSPYCLSQFVAATNGQKVNPRFIGSCGFLDRCGAVPGDLRRMNCGDPDVPAPGQVRRGSGGRVDVAQRRGPLGRPPGSVG